MSLLFADSHRQESLCHAIRLTVAVTFVGRGVPESLSPRNQDWLRIDCRVILLAMSHRILALVAVLALFSAPAAILAGTVECAPTACTEMCCARHAHNTGAHAAEAQCHHSGGQHDARCSGTPRGHIDFGFASPLPPTIFVVTVKVGAPRFASSAIAERHSTILSGFVDDLIKPPRT
jgi:hypothetical protein